MSSNNAASLAAPFPTPNPESFAIYPHSFVPISIRSEQWGPWDVVAPAKSQGHQLKCQELNPCAATLWRRIDNPCAATLWRRIDNPCAATLWRRIDTWESKARLGGRRKLGSREMKVWVWSCGLTRHRIWCKLYNLTLLKKITNRPSWKHVSYMYPLKGVRPINTLIEWHQSYWCTTWTQGCHSYWRHVLYLIYVILCIFMIKNNYLYYSRIYSNFSLDRKVYNEQILSLWKEPIV
jgi:hypothetical protein